MKNKKNFNSLYQFPKDVNLRKCLDLITYISVRLSVLSFQNIFGRSLSRCLICPIISHTFKMAKPLR